ncbi:hypothetical protein CFOL_v3_08649 [Cephalotus follicularis]|uniref:Uncharacterized protein n=1 Tax=Cephalotus follicularis TaxID=3775 RepID=A0A1Q3BBC0_CEPFO|nr:hypothetical protein CFOL_v3_08649 [Cephalotus follicularis]
MKKKLEVEHEQELEILKAVAQAWHSHSGSSKVTNEYDAHRRNFKSQPSRFKVEAMNKSLGKDVASAHWDFGQSLWDSYEIVAVSKRLTGLDYMSRVRRRPKEKKNSLRNLFNRTCSRRFVEAVTPREAPEDNTNF